MYFDIGVEFKKLLAQLKERWRALLDKYKLSVCDNNNRKGRERKTFKRYEDIYEFKASSDEVNPRFVNETKAHIQDYSSNDTDDVVSTGNQDCGKKPEKRPVALLKAIVQLQRKLEKIEKRRKKKPEEQEKRLSGDDTELETLDMMKSQQESIQRSEENDESVFKALLKSRAEAQR